jgi:hypothetical protein
VHLEMPLAPQLSLFISTGAPLLGLNETRLSQNLKARLADVTGMQADCETGASRVEEAPEAGSQRSNRGYIDSEERFEIQLSGDYPSNRSRPKVH